MGRVFALMLGAILPVAVAAVPGPHAAAAEPAPLKIGLPESLFSGLPPAIVEVGSQPFKAMFEKQTGLKGEIVVTKDHAESAAALRNKKIDVAVFHGFEYGWVKQHKELVPLLVTVPRHKLQASLVVNVKCKAAGPNELKGACVAVPPSTKAHCRLFLDRLQQKLPAGCCGTAKPDNKSIEEVLDEVATGTREAAVVDNGALLSYQNNKPGVAGQLKVMAESETFPSAIVVYREGVFSPEKAKQVRDGLVKSIAAPQGQLLANLWKLKGFADVDDTYRADLDRSLKAYPAPKSN